MSEPTRTFVASCPITLDIAGWVERVAPLGEGQRRRMLEWLAAGLSGSEEGQMALEMAYALALSM